MGHDISGINKAREEVAYARFSMGNYNAIILYDLLDAHIYYAGVSGTGKSCTYSKEQIEMAVKIYNEKFGKDNSLSEKNLDLKQIRDFIQNCMATAQKEGNVIVYFG